MSFEYNGVVSNTVGFKNVTSKKQIYNVNASTNNGNLIKKKKNLNKIKSSLRIKKCQKLWCKIEMNTDYFSCTLSFLNRCFKSATQSKFRSRESNRQS